jgi:hypothetical protein
MKTFTHTSRLILATSLLVSFAAAHAAGGFTVTHDQEKLVAVGMTVGEVQQALGRPALTEQFRNEPGPTLSYNVIGGANQTALFDVDFGSNGQVASVSERMLDSGGQ